MIIDKVFPLVLLNRPYRDQRNTCGTISYKHPCVSMVNTGFNSALVLYFGLFCCGFAKVPFTDRGYWPDLRDSQ